ncbi:MAG: UDP-N-acetylmuramate dehydrogenase [Bacteroidia bacterium]|nr:UDP-N-acetylmuramate dehydrogenase [Bacteroidia bacterium]MCF8426763.1 UDP-N-acetylmuramate dehydrogenase [Bacteroidia bacterium]MCF8445555.1 UDP-N-acetylmuramate dehydrogenase [Bacteroidia bacterium]
MIIYQNISLKPYNTFGIDVKAQQFVEVNTIEEVQVLCSTFILHERKFLILGGGSNILLTKDFDGMVIKMNLKGMDAIREDENHVWIKALSGEIWHDFVTFCVDKNLSGVENLSLIPGCVGAAPMQNIGAYGAEIKDTFEELFAIEIESSKLVKFTNAECKFGYRESIFKNEAKNKYIIVAVTFKLSKTPKLNTQYGAIQETLGRKGITEPKIKDISEAIIEIRSSKLPDPKVLGNSGSFFKNPEIPASQYQVLKEKFSEIPGYPLENNLVKVPAGWLIEQCGWKGKKVGNTGSHKDQALVLVNYGGATGDEIYQLAMAIQGSVQEKFGIKISPEVNLV